MSAHVVPSESGPVLGLLDTHVEAFFAHLRTEGYAERTLRKKRGVVQSFARWTRRRRIAIEDLDDVANVEVAIRSEGRSMIMVLAPKPAPKKKDTEKKQQERTADAEDQNPQGSGEEIQAN